jgi:lipopolysaccharide/colanic/teichoic acid biosynthesis glycosyltransferase
MVALVALLLLLPVMLAVALLIKLEGPGPVIYRQLRIGFDRRRDSDQKAAGGKRATDLGGRPFMMYKFRTMREDAETDSGPVWASPSDERVTRVGRFLRRTCLDELPQFWNVIKGDMSVVGPRPERPFFVLQLREEIDGYQSRHRVRPGITGWAQLHVGSDHSIDDVQLKLDYDLEYLRRRSFWLDMRIMLKTLPVIFDRDADIEL